VVLVLIFHSREPGYLLEGYQRVATHPGWLVTKLHCVASVEVFGWLWSQFHVAQFGCSRLSCPGPQGEEGSAVLGGSGMLLGSGPGVESLVLLWRVCLKRSVWKMGSTGVSEEAALWMWLLPTVAPIDELSICVW